MSEPPVGRRRIGGIDEVGDPEASLAVQQLGAAALVERLEGRVDQLAGGGVDVRRDGLQPLGVPLLPGAPLLAVGGAVAVGDEAGGRELDRAGDLSLAGASFDPLKGPRSS